ncbi:DUF4332 domain-containing protein [Denitrobaculum tricleocarpae]|nr:DUF4332 domain-containing protein [Denitrobaculum tricleocarpae]
MSYHIDDQSLGLKWLEERLRNTDLIPSQKPLLDGVSKKMHALAEAGVQSLGDLRTALKTEKSLTSLSRRSAVEADYLQSLRRAVNGFFPKPRAFKDMDWLDEKTVASLDKLGLKNTQQLFEAASSGEAGLDKETDFDRNQLKNFMSISDLCRIQWVSPNFARVLAAAGFKTADAVAHADPETLFHAIARANEGARFYKGKVGLRDVQRLVAAAAYVP